jgi:MOSC domain-containing protein YiiM
MVNALFIKIAHGEAMSSVRSLAFTNAGIVGNVPCPPLRQVVILPLSTLHEFKIKAGDLRENILVDYEKLHELESGTVIKIGSALIYLTLHCEACSKIASMVNIRQIQHRRGYLGSFLNTGTIFIGDSIEVTPTKKPAIPFDLSERVAWFLDQQKDIVSAHELLLGIGLNSKYARTIPGLLRKLPDKYRDKVIFKYQEQ